jgi:hypothetical protein
MAARAGLHGLDITQNPCSPALYLCTKLVKPSRTGATRYVEAGAVSNPLIFSTYPLGWRAPMGILMQRAQFARMRQSNLRTELSTCRSGKKCELSKKNELERNLAICSDDSEDYSL